MATQEMLRGNWNSIVGAVKEKFGQITGDDLMRVQGNLDQFVGLMQKKAGQTREQVEQFLEECCSSSSKTFSNAVESVAATAGQAGRYVSDGFRYAADSVERGYDQAHDVVERRPLESVALVAGVSLIAGVLIGLSLCGKR